MMKPGLNFFKDLFWMANPLFCLVNEQNAGLELQNDIVKT
jgi:hypothetical protein